MNQRRSPAARRPPRGAAGPAGSGSNAGARGALLLGVAVILGIVLLQKFDTDVSSVGTGSEVTVPTVEAPTTTRRVGLTTVPPVTPTTGRARAKAEVKVQVANGAGVRGLAGSTTEALRGAGYTAILPPTDVSSGTVDKTSIQFAEGFEAEAREVAAALSQPPTAVTRIPTPPVALSAPNEEARVFVILGSDVANPTSTVAGATTTTTRRP
jgi:D-alanine-D-alanine ligase-like ATP-grasp enzyme